MNLGMQVGLGPGHTVRWELSSSSPKRAQSLQFSAHICCGRMDGWIKMPLGMEVSFGPGDFVLDGDPAPLPKKGAEPPIFRPISIVARRLDASICHLVWRWASAQATFCYMENKLPPPKKKWGTAPNFRPMSVVAKRLDGSRRHLVRR